MALTVTILQKTNSEYERFGVLKCEPKQMLNKNSMFVDIISTKFD